MISFSMRRGSISELIMRTRSMEQIMLERTCLAASARSLICRRIPLQPALERQQARYRARLQTRRTAFRGPTILQSLACDSGSVIDDFEQRHLVSGIGANSYRHILIGPLARVISEVAQNLHKVALIAVRTDLSGGNIIRESTRYGLWDSDT